MIGWALRSVAGAILFGSLSTLLVVVITALTELPLDTRVFVLLLLANTSAALAMLARRVW